MEPLNHLESFVQSAEGGSFSEAARRLGLTPAAVSKNVARLEARLGVRLFQRSTRRLTLTEGGERFLAQVAPALATLQEAVAGVDTDDGQPAGTLKVSMGQAFGREHVLPMMGDFLARYPAILPDWHFDNQQVDLVGEGFDAAIGGGIELPAGMVARELARIHVVAVASPAYMEGRQLPKHPSELAALDTLLRRSSPTGRVRSWTLRRVRAGAGEGEISVELPRPRAIFNDPEAIAHAALMGLGAAMLPLPFVERGLRSGALLRLLPEWYQDAGAVWLYYPSKKLLPPKTRVFIDFVLERLRSERFAQRMQVA
ncbi:MULTISPECIES: LysR family transcriptional regulator [unclassified Variovorax]|uniref:LysR family transcriptional regulator n=1 Tax=unclassified Variovorax TaxID=663243 RepID=UPI000F7EF5B3|nr:MULTISPECIES: LysR family transcriptional regulator [unclassified Variovorax]RSZ38523.1 LysR family transcriptional regulator [Variovorax sp. 553]RSZ39026.1 LysR family transcriptional regulator [Variovorax sp. 679]